MSMLHTDVPPCYYDSTGKPSYALELDKSLALGFPVQSSTQQETQMQIRTAGPHISGLVATVEGTFEEAYAVAMHFWAIAGEEGVHMDGLEIWEDDGGKPLLRINYCTHER